MTREIINGHALLTGNAKSLHEVSEPIHFSAMPQDYVDTLQKACDVHIKAQGFSLPQFGINRRMLIMVRKGKRTIMINPEILMKLGVKGSNEGCESIEGRYIVKRPFITLVRYLDENGKQHTKWFMRHSSRIICHEVDHLDGILISDVGKRWVYAYK